MAIKIRFDNENNIIDPTIVLMSRSAVKYGSLQYNGLKAKINFNSYSELSFNVDKALCSEDLWGKLVDFKLIWVKDWNACFEINVDINEDNGISKTITAKSLGESELAQVNLYNIEVNTEDDIERSDYVPTILYNEENHKASLIHRLLEKCPHYRIGHIDSSIAGAQRTFQFNNQSILDAFDTISKEIDCVFIIDCSINAEGDLVRTINIYDLEFSCVDCGHRWEHIADTCPSCNGTNINTGYGEDTHIFISSKNLAQQINYTTSTGSVKNCFKLQAGDDLMTSAVINCNPNGGQYLWYISDEVKEDMSDELSQKIDEYEDLCEYYQNEYQVDISSDDVNNYNRIIQKYSIYSQDHEQISLPIIGYSDLVKNLYNVLDFDIYLSNELMPTPQMINTTAEEQVAKLTTQSLSPVSVTDLSNLSLATANNVVLGMARVIVDNRYKITIVNSTLSNNTWQGSFCVTNYSNDDDTSTSGNINITINDDYENFLKQKIDKALQKSMTTNEAIDIVDLFKLGISDFTNEIKKYSLSILKSFYDNCQTCLDVLIEQGIANGETWGDKNPNLYTELYIPYRNKLTAIESEIALRESEIKVVKDIEDYLYDIKGDVQASLNLQAFLGDTLWEQFSAYRREDTYQNDNYISDGLGNSEMFEKAKAFIAEAQKNIYKSANLQHSISSTLKNLLMLREFQTLKDYFEEGNWLRIETDGEINRLRLMSYEVDYENTNDLSVEFSDVSKLKDGISDIQSVLDNSKSIASSFNAVTRQAKNGNDSRKTIDKWINSGIALNNIKIIQDAENQNVIFDNNGILCREYLPMIDSYDERQLKIINKGLFLTDDNWQSAKVGIGEIEYNGEKSYGVNAQLLVGDIIIGNELHIKDSQGHDILTVIDGRISTEVSEVKAAAASGTFEYYDPSNLNWTEQNNVDYFGYGLSQDEAETDTGIKAAGNNNKYFLNKHNGNLYKSNGTKWVFQKTLSPRFNNYSTIAYTDNKASTAESNAKTYAEGQANTAESNAKTYAEGQASTAESNAIANATNQVSTAKATIASSTLKYDETGITVSYYGYGVPTEIAGATQGKIYLDQNDGYYYTKGSGSNWTKSSSALPLYADQKANVAKSEAISVASADAAQKANQAEENAIADATNQVNNATTTIANATNKYDTTGLTITYFGYGVPDIATATSGQKYLDQNDGYVYTKKSGSGWTKSASALTLITTKVATDAANDATTKANNAISTAATDATAKANTAENNAKTAAANAMSKYDEGSLTINYYGFGAPTIVAGSSQGEIYLDQNTGYYYTKGSGSTWAKSSTALPLYADQKAAEAYGNAVNYVTTYYITEEETTRKMEMTEQGIEMRIGRATSKYEIPAGITINYAGFGDPTTQGAVPSATNQYYLDQETGDLYKSNSSLRWGSTPTQRLTLITDSLGSRIDMTERNITLAVDDATTTIAIATSKYDTTGLIITYYGYGAPDNITGAQANQKYLDQNDGFVYTKNSGSGWTKSSTALTLLTTKVASDAANDATTKANAAKDEAIDTATTTVANATSKYDTTGLTITYYGYGDPGIISGAEINQKYLDQEGGFVWTKTSSGWSKDSETPLTLITTKVANDAKNYTDSQIVTTTTQMNTKIDETAGHIISSANARLEQTIGYEASKNIFEIIPANQIITETGTLHFTTDAIAGTISANGTTGSSAASVKQRFLVTPELAGRYYFSASFNQESPTNTFRAYVYNVGVGFATKWDGTTRSPVITGQESQEVLLVEGYTVEVTFNVYANKSVDNVICKPMLRAEAYVADPTFEPYREAQTVQSQISEANSKIVQTAHGITQTVAAANAVEYIIPSGVTVDYHGYGFGQTSGGAIDYTMTDTGISAVGISGHTFLNQSNGILYTSDGTTWENTQQQLATKFSEYSTTSQTRTEINQTANAIQMKAAKAVSKYQIPNGMTIHIAGYGTPIAQGAVATEANQNYLDQETGRVYTSKANKSWDMNSYQSLRLITDNLDTKIDVTAQGITHTVSQTYSTKSETSDKAAEAEANAKSTTAAGAGKYVIPTGLTITYYGYGLTNNDTKTDTGISATASDVSGKYFLNLTDGNVYQSNGIKWNKDTTVSPLKLASKQAEDNAKDYTDTQIAETVTSMNTKIDQTAEQISLEANALLEATVGYTSKNRIEMTISTVTKNGITFTVDKSAGTITVSGTATKQAAVSVPISPELSGDYYFSGAPVGGSSSKYDLYAWDVTTGARVKKFDGVTNCSSDYGGTSQEIKLIKGHTSQLTVRIQSGFTANNLVFRLMIRDKAFADDDTFEPFANVQSVTTNLQSQITQNANQIQLKVSAGDVCSVISQSSDTITLSSGRLIINTGNFQLDSTGRMAATAGSFGGWEIGSEYVQTEYWEYNDYYIESVNNVYGSIKWHSIGYGEIPVEIPPWSVTALDITDKDGNELFKVMMDGSISTEGFLYAKEGYIETALIGERRLGEKYLILRTGDFSSSADNPPAYLTFYDTTNNDTLSLVTEGIKWKGSSIFAEVTNFLNVGTALAFGASSMPLRLASSIVEVDHSMNFYTAGDGIQLSGNHCFRLYNDEVAIGISSKNVRFYAQNVYLPNGSAVTSDKRQKHNIERLDERYLDVIKNIEPVRFQYLNNPLDNYHSGFIAQDVLKALSAAGLSQSEVGAFVDTKGDGSDYALRYGEFIPMLQKWVKELDDRITEIERKIRNE